MQRRDGNKKKEMQKMIKIIKEKGMEIEKTRNRKRGW